MQQESQLILLQLKQINTLIRSIATLDNQKLNVISKKIYPNSNQNK